MKQHPSPHDSLFKAIFTERENALAIMEAALPLELFQAIDRRSVEHQDGTYIDRALRHRYSDLLFRAKLQGKEALVYVLLEHQSTVDALMPLRLLRPMERVWDKWIARNRTATALPR